MQYNQILQKDTYISAKPQIAILAALRDFFVAKNSDAMQRACVRLGVASEENSINWREVEYTFNSLFVGPMAVQAPLYASVYLEPEPQLMGRVCLEMRNLYDELSLAVPPMGQCGVLPDDHIALELDALIALLAVQDWCNSFEGSHAVKDECSMHLSYVLKHMTMWISQFAEKACQKNTLYNANSDIRTLMQNIMDILLLTINNVSVQYERNTHKIN